MNKIADVEKYKARIMDKQVERYLDTFGAVCIEGPKWCGKTWISSYHANSEFLIADSANNFQNRRLAEMSPSLVLEGETPRLIDEWQIAPKLWDATRYEVDTRGEEGQFILTGSAVPVDSKDITHSGTGRFTWLTMRPMSLYESADSTGQVSLKDLFDKPDSLEGENNLNIDKLAFLICRGGWPHAVGMREKIALAQAEDYYEAVIKSDINRADGVSKNPERVKRLLRSLARNQGAQIANTMLKNDIVSNDTESLNEDTIASYLNALKKIFVIEDMPAWNPNLRSKTSIRSSDTRYFVDPSIAVSALGAGPQDLINDLNTMGLLFETLCVRDLRVYAEKIGGSVLHYRDKSGLECDTVIHLKNGRYGLAEIKLGGQKLIEEGAANLKALSNKIDTSKMLAPSFLMIIIGVGEFAYKREDGIFIVPIGCLKD